VLVARGRGNARWCPIAHGEDIGGGAAPHTIEVSCDAAGHRAPGAAIVVEDGALIAHDENIGVRAASDTIKVTRGAAGH